MNWTAEVGTTATEHATRDEAVTFVQNRTRNRKIAGVVVQYDETGMPKTTILIRDGVVERVASSTPREIAQARFDVANTAYRADPNASTERELRIARHELKKVKTL